MRLSVVIPCLNEAKTIAAVVREAEEALAACAPRLEWSEIVVADNGSTDGSRELAVEAGARVVDCPVRGYGGALHGGILAAQGEYVVLGDADRAHDYRLIEDFLRLIEEHGEQDLVLASRLAGDIEPGAMSFLNRYLGTPVLNFAIWSLFGLRTSDCNSGQRMVRRAFYEQLHMRGTGMEFASEMLIKTAIRDGRFREFPGRVRPDERGRPSHMRRWRDGWRHLTTIAALSPNRTWAVVVAALLASTAALWSAEPAVACAAAWSAFAALLTMLTVKLVLHLEDLRPSRSVAFLLRVPTVEVGIVAGVAAIAHGVSGLRAPGVELEQAAAFGWATGGVLTCCSMLLWSSLRTQRLLR